MFREVYVVVYVLLTLVLSSGQTNSFKMSGKRRTSGTRSFRSRSRGRGDSSFYSGMSVVNVEMTENGVFLNKELRKCSENLGQIIIVDSGCPRSLLGDKELERLKELVEVKEFAVKSEGFRFGPSRVYSSNQKVILTMQVGIHEIDCEFFVVTGNVPILLGNDVMVPLGGKIDMVENILVLKNVDMEIPIIPTQGGHFVIPVRSVAGIDAKNIIGDEADAVMMIVLERTDCEEMKKLHDEVGHSTFVALGLSDDEETQVQKVHRYFGHRSSRRIWDLFAKAKQLRGKKRAVLEVIDNCKTCSEFKKSPPRPKVGLPVANDFNEIVGLDLKVLSKTKGEYILWMVDMFSKMIKGKFIKNKHPETIIDGIVSSWIMGDGIGPGHPRKGFWSDNGGEFLNERVLDFAAAMDVNIKMTSAEAPWQNGVVERHHATADIIFDKLMKDNPKMDPQEAINHAAFAKNTDTNQTGFSPIQLMTGQNPKFPGLSEANPASSNLENSNKYMKTLKAIDYARVKMREIDCDAKLKKVRSERINPNVEKFYNLGDPVFFYDDKKKQWKKATALIRLGKTLYLRFGNFLRRVAIDKVRPDINGEIDKEEGYAETENDVDEARFREEETPVVEMASDLGLADQNSTLKNQVEKLVEEDAALRKQVEDLEHEVATLKDSKSKTQDDVDKNETVDKTKPVDKTETAESDNVAKMRKLKKKAQKAKKQAEQVKVPKSGQNILFKESESKGWKSARVVGSWKKNSIYKYWKHLLIDKDLVVEKDFENGILEWKVQPENENGDNAEEEDILDNFFLESDSDEVFPVQIIPRKDYGKPEVQAAIVAEIAKFKSFNAFKEVEDQGQKSIPTKWVVTDQSDSGKNEPYKARMCIRGDLENGKDVIRSDSPTASKEAIKLALIIAANEGFKVQSGDIKSAYLQGELLKREIFVKPPKEANANGKLWLLLQAAYGIVDGGRLFYLKLSEKLCELGMHRVHSDGALFTYVKEGKLHGLVTTHSDDLILAGDKIFERDITSKLKETFKFSKVEKNNFKYCGCNVKSNEDGTIELDQNDYVDRLKELDVDDANDSTELSRQEIKAVRGKIGELLWLSLMTRPDLSYDVNILSSEVANGTIATLKAVNKIVRKAKGGKSVLRFSKLGKLSDLSVKVYADASYGNQFDKIRSTAGRVILIQNKKTGKVNVSSWKTKKIGRVCRSVKSAETRALEEAIDDGVNVARLLVEVYTGQVNLKDPEQIPVEALTDSKSLWESLHNTRQCEEKLLRNSIAGMKELIELKLVRDVSWVPTLQQLADCMTKGGKNSDWLLRVASKNRLD